MSDISTEKQLNILDEDGIIILENVLDITQKECAVSFGTMIANKIISEASSHISHDDYGPDRFLLRTRDLQKTLPVPSLLLPKKVEPLISAVFNRAGTSGTTPHLKPGSTFQTAGMAAHILLPGGTQRPLHRDVEPLFSGAYPDMPAFSLAMHIPVTEFNDLTGGTRIAVGTHRHVVNPVKSYLGSVYEEKACTVTASPGDIIIFDNRVWHASGSNKSENARIMLSVLFIAEWFGKWQAEVPEYIYKDLPEQMKLCMEICR